jgi:hypothetical protein
MVMGNRKADAQTTNSEAMSLQVLSMFDSVADVNQLIGSFPINTNPTSIDTPTSIEPIPTIHISM